MELKDTVDNMLSDDYKKRLVAEYHQLKARYESLRSFNTKIEASVRTQYTDNPLPMPQHDCPETLLREQQSIMGNYLRVLEIMAQIEGVEL